MGSILSIGEEEAVVVTQPGMCTQEGKERTEESEDSGEDGHFC